MNENLYIAHKKLPHKTLRVHSAKRQKTPPTTTTTTTKNPQRMYLWWCLCTLYLHACQVRVTVGDSGLCCCTCVLYFERNNNNNKPTEDVSVVVLMYLVFTRVPGESYRRRLRSLLLYLCSVFRALINSLV